MARGNGRPFVKGDPRIKPNPGGRKKAKTLDQELDAAERQLRVELLQIAKDRTCEPGPRIKAIQALRQLRETSAQSRRHYVMAVPAELTVEDWAKSVEAWEQFDLNRSR